MTDAVAREERRPAGLEDGQARDGNGGEDGEDGERFLHEAEAHVVLDEEMISRGGRARVIVEESESADAAATTAATTADDDSGAPSGAASATASPASSSSSASSSDGLQDVISGAPAIVLRESGPSLPVLLSRIFMASRLSLVFRRYHQLIVQMIALANLDTTTPPQLAAAFPLKQPKSSRQKPPLSSQTLYPVPQYVNHWFDMDDAHHAVGPVALAVDDILCRVLDEILDTRVTPSAIAGLCLHMNPAVASKDYRHVLAKLVLCWLDAVYVSNDTSDSDSTNLLQANTMTRWQGSEASGLVEAELCDLFDMLTDSNTRQTQGNTRNSAGVDEDNLTFMIDMARVNPSRATALFTVVQNNVHICVPTAMSELHPAELILSTPPLHLVAMTRSILAASQLRSFVQGQHAVFDTLGNSAFHILAMPSLAEASSSSSSSTFDSFADTLYSLPGDNVDGRLRAPNALGQTPLHLSAKSGHTNAVRWFLKKGVQPSARTLRATTSSMLARDASALDSFSGVIFRELREHEHLCTPEDWTWPWNTGMARKGRFFEVSGDQNAENRMLSDPKTRARDAFLAPRSRSRSPSFTAMTRHQSALDKAFKSRNMFASFACFRMQGTSTSSLEDVLHAAIEQDSLPLVMLSLNRGASVQALETMCLARAEREHSESLKSSSSLPSPTRNQHSSSPAWRLPLHAAALNSHAALVRLLVGAGASMHLRSPDGASVLHRIDIISKPYSERWENSLGQRAYRSRTLSDADVADMLAERQEIYYRERQLRERTLETARALLTLGADAEAADNSGCTPLHIAVKRGDYVYAELLLAHGARPGFVAQPTSALSRGTTETTSSPLHLAISTNHLRCLRSLLCVRGSAGLACSRRQIRAGESAISFAASTQVNFPATGILANAGPVFSDWSRTSSSKRRPTLVGALADACLKMVQQQQTAKPTAQEMKRQLHVTKMIMLLLQNGAASADRERVHFDALTSLIPGLRKEFSEARSVGADRKASQSSRRSAPRYNRGEECLSFWAHPKKPVCYGVECERHVSKGESLLFCKSCGLSYCKKCRCQEDEAGRGEYDVGTAKSGKPKKVAVMTSTGDSLPGCLCIGCSSW